MAGQTGSFIWYELMTEDLDEAATFYGAVMGWTSVNSPVPGMTYRMWSTGSAIIGGCLKIPDIAKAAGGRAGWLGYVQVPDVDASLKSIQAADGRVTMPATDIPGVGRIAMVADPQGAAIYIMTPNGAAQSVAFSADKIGHCSWNELHAKDWESAFAFYAAQFGWRKTNTMDMGPMGTYLMFNSNGLTLGGMFNSPIPHPSWLYYFQVDNIDAAKSRVETAGGSIVNGPTQIPGDSWVVQCQDNQNAMFALVGPR